MLAKIEEVKTIEEVETDVGVIRELPKKKGIVVENKDLAVHIEKNEDGTYRVFLNITVWRRGHDHNDKIYIDISGIPAETVEPSPITRGVFKLVRSVKIKVDGDPVEIARKGWMDA